MADLLSTSDPTVRPVAARPPGAGRETGRGAMRAAGRARAERLLDAADRLILSGGTAALSLPAVAAEAGAPASSLYHFFPTADALLTALLERYNRLQDQEFETVMAAADPARGWTVLVDALLAATRDFYDQFPVYGRLMARAGASPRLAAADQAHMQALGERFAAALAALYHLPPVPDLALRLTLAVMVIDRLWSSLPLDAGKISNFAFEESRRMALSYLSNILPPAPLPKAAAR